MKGLLCYCRAGFEKDLATELEDKSSRLQIYGFARFKPNTGYLVFECYQPEQVLTLANELDFNQLIFARQLIVLKGQLEELGSDDRISPMLEYLEDFPQCGDIWVEHADTTTGRELSRFCRKFTVPLRQALRKKSLLSAKDDSRLPSLHAFFTNNQQVMLGYSIARNRAAQPMGIMRLKFPPDAPSRSTLKLDEAFQTFIPKAQHKERLAQGMQAVDLGACPGGWTYQLVRRGMQVQAIDNGAMDDKLMATGLVDYFAADGFTYKPWNKKVHWLVCDMIEKPDRVAQLMASWLVKGWCDEAMFNLKLPMKRRYESVQQAFALIAKEMQQGQMKYQLQAKHLYHDREEITVHLRARN